MELNIIDITDEMKIAVYEKYIGTQLGCCYCCRKEKIYGDHFPVLYNRYGPPTVENIRPLCARCDKEYFNFDGHLGYFMINKRKCSYICKEEDNYKKTGIVCQNMGCIDLVDGKWRCIKHSKSLPSTYSTHDIYPFHDNDSKMMNQYIRDYGAAANRAEYRKNGHGNRYEKSDQDNNENSNKDNNQEISDMDEVYGHLETALFDSAEAMDKCRELEEKNNKLEESVKILTSNLEELRNLVISLQEKIVINERSATNQRSTIDEKSVANNSHKKKELVCEYCELSLIKQTWMWKQCINNHFHNACKYCVQHTYCPYEK